MSFKTYFITSVRKILIGTMGTLVIVNTDTTELVVTSPVRVVTISVRVADSSNSELMIMSSLRWLETILE
jgi:hypothetical protein